MTAKQFLISMGHQLNLLLTIGRPCGSSLMAQFVPHIRRPFESLLLLSRLRDRASNSITEAERNRDGLGVMGESSNNRLTTSRRGETGMQKLPYAGTLATIFVPGINRV